MKSLLLILFIPFLCISQTTDWVKSFGGHESDKGISNGVDAAGYIYISGFFNTTADFDDINLINDNAIGTNKEFFFIKMDSLGSVLWAIPGGNLDGSCCDDKALGMHVTANGDVFLTGTFWSTFYMGNCSVEESNAHDTSILVKIDSYGNCVWVTTFGADGLESFCDYPIYDSDDHSYDVKIDEDGFIYVTGFFSGPNAEFDDFILTNPDWESTCTPLGYVGKLNANGEWLWVDKFDGIEDNRGSRDNRIAIDEFSNVYVCGGFGGIGNYGPLTVTSNGEFDAFLFKMSPDGDWLWVKNVGSNKADRANGIAIDKCNDIYINGEYRNPMVFLGANASNGTDTLSHKRKRDVFVAKCDSDGEWLWAKRARSSGVDKPYQMSVDDNRQVFICGTTADTTKFSDDIVVSSPFANDTTSSAFVAQLDGNGIGEWLWAKTAGSFTDDDDRTNDICPDGYGNVYAVGFFEDTATFDNTTLITKGKKDIFVWKMRAMSVDIENTSTYDTIYIDKVVCEIDKVGIFTSTDTLLVSCDTLFVDSVFNNVLDTNIEMIRNIHNIYNHSCFPSDTGRFLIKSDTIYMDCDTIIDDTFEQVSLLSSKLFYNKTTHYDSTCNVLDTGLVLNSSDIIFIDCDTIINDDFTHYSLMLHLPNCDDNNCKTLDTYDPIDCHCIHQEIIYHDCLDIYFPNAFSPNEDYKNEIFKPKIYNEHLIKAYQLMVFNRWGSNVFSTTDFNQGWDNSNAPNGIYTCIAYVTDINGYYDRLIGEVTLIK